MYPHNKSLSKYILSPKARHSWYMHKRDLQTNVFLGENAKGNTPI